MAKPPLELADSTRLLAGSPTIRDCGRPSVSATAFAMGQRSPKADMVLATRAGSTEPDSARVLLLDSAEHDHGFSSGRAPRLGSRPFVRPRNPYAACPALAGPRMGANRERAPALYWTHC